MNGDEGIEYGPAAIMGSQRKSACCKCSWLLSITLYTCNGHVSIATKDAHLCQLCEELFSDLLLKRPTYVTISQNRIALHQLLSSNFEEGAWGNCQDISFPGICCTTPHMGYRQWREETRKCPTLPRNDMKNTYQSIKGFGVSLLCF